MPVTTPPDVRTPAELEHRAQRLEADAARTEDRKVAVALRLRARRLRAQAAGMDREAK